MESDLFQQVVFCTSGLASRLFDCSWVAGEQPGRGCPGGGRLALTWLAVPHGVGLGLQLAVMTLHALLAAYLMDRLLLSCFLEPPLWKGSFSQCH